MAETNISVNADGNDGTVQLKECRNNTFFYWKTSSGLKGTHLHQLCIVRVGNSSEQHVWNVETGSRLILSASEALMHESVYPVEKAEIRVA